MEVRKLLIRIGEVASVCDDGRYKAALIHQRQRLVNRLNEFADADRRKAELLEKTYSNDNANNDTYTVPAPVPAPAAD